MIAKAGGALVFFLALLTAAQAKPIMLQPEMRRISLNANALYRVETEKKSPGAIMALGEGSFESLAGKSSFGYSTGTYWVRLRAQNPQQSIQHFYIEYDFSPFDDIQIYSAPVIDGEVDVSQLSREPIRGGDRYPFSQRAVDYRNPVFSFSLQPGETVEYLLRLQTSSSMVVSLYGYTGDQLASYIASEQIILGLYYGIMLAMVVTNLFLLISLRDRTYLFYVLYIITYVLFQATLNGLSFQYLWPNQIEWGNDSLPFFIFLACSAILLFCRSYLNTKEHTPGTDRLYWVVLVFNITGLFSALFLFNYRINLIASVVFTFITLTLILFSGFQTLFLKVRQARFFLVAWIIFLIGGALNIFKSAGWLPDHFLTTYGIQIGSALEVMLLSLGMGDRINQLSASLHSNVRELSAARNNAEQVSTRLRTLVEEADDFIFTLDETWNFTMVNKAFQRSLKYSTEELLEMNFLELIYNRDWKDSLNKIFVLEKLEELTQPGTSISFQTEFKQKHVMEPRDASVRLQYLEYEDGRREILGRSTLVTEDVLARYLIRERVEFAIENYVRNAEILSQRLSSLVARFADSDMQMTVRTSLREIIINAIEHGNLEITFDEKTAALEEGSYLALIEQRRNDERYKKRKVQIEYAIDSDRVAFRITDEGKGFDHRKMLQTDERELNAQYMAHGRGIMMTVSAFDIVRYNEKGNRVALVKYFKKHRKRGGV
ncbi:MAG: ATP-binding protein [Leptospiraceae bacterium]|nr:ATP-binding protein [Leptospiraceae bacterium]